MYEIIFDKSQVWRENRTALKDVLLNRNETEKEIAKFLYDNECCINAFGFSHKNKCDNIDCEECAKMVARYIKENMIKKNNI